MSQSPQLIWKDVLVIGCISVAILAGLFAIGSYYVWNGIIQSYLEAEALGDEADRYRVAPGEADESPQ